MTARGAGGLRPDMTAIAERRRGPVPRVSFQNATFVNERRSLPPDTWDGQKWDRIRLGKAERNSDDLD
jgi:hypothetical protein